MVPARRRGANFGLQPPPDAALHHHGHPAPVTRPAGELACGGADALRQPGGEVVQGAQAVREDVVERLADVDEVQIGPLVEGGH